MMKEIADKNFSPVGWYLCSYLLRFIELADTDNENLEKRFLTWENTVLIKANDMDEAYEKTMRIGKECTQPYKGGEHGVDVQWVLEGVTQVLPIYEELEDGAEIAWQERAPSKLKNLRQMVGTKDSFRQ